MGAWVVACGLEASGAFVTTGAGFLVVAGARVVALVVAGAFDSSGGK